MPKIADRRTRYSAVVKGEALLDRNYENDVKTLTMTTDYDIGTVFNAADGTVYVAADDGVATAVWILTDPDTYKTVTANGDYDLMVMTGGPGGSGWAEVARQELKFGDALSAGQLANVYALLEGQGIRLVDSY